MLPALSIDFGTTTTVAAVRDEAGRPTLVAIDGSPLLPSAVFLTDNGTLTVGRDAERESRLDPSRYEPNPKRRIDDGEVLLGRAAVGVREVIAAVLRRVATEVTRQYGGLPPDIWLTHPAGWGRARRSLLLEAAAAAGLGRGVRLLPEPVAAATHYAATTRSTRPGSGVAVYDLGGGTFDVAVLRLDRDGRWEVVTAAGRPDVGGIDFDHALAERITAALSEADRATLDALRHPADAAGRRALRGFEHDVRDAKEALSRATQAEVPLPPPLPDALVTRDEFEALIRPALTRTVDLLAEQLDRAAMPGTGVYLVGGSSRIPLVAQLIRQRTGILPTALDQPETAVATGALFLPTPAPASSGAVPAPPPAPAPPVPTPPPDQRPVEDWARPVPARPDRSRRLIAAAVAAVLLAAGIVAAVLLSGGGDHPAATPPHHRATASADGPTTGSSPTTTPTTADPLVARFDRYFPNADVRAYMRPVYAVLASCDPADRSGLTFCTLKNGLRVELASDVNQGRFSSGRGSTLATGSRSWTEARWSRGAGTGLIRTFLRHNDAGRPIVYWDRSNAVWGIMGVGTGSNLKTNAAVVREVWRSYFAR